MDRTQGRCDDPNTETNRDRGNDPSQQLTPDGLGKGGVGEQHVFQKLARIIPLLLLDVGLHQSKGLLLVNTGLGHGALADLALIDIVLGQRDGVALKPAPDALYSIMDELDVTKEETAYIGDAEPDVMTAKNASVALGVSVLWGFRNEAQLSSAGAEIFVHSPMQVVDLIKG